MNSERRRRARIQGGWASPSPKTSNVRSDRNKTQVQPCPVWTGKNIDCQRSPATFVYEEPTEELQEKPAERVIKNAGVYDISTEPSGVSRIRYFPNFIESDEASWMFEQLYDEIGWKRKSDVKNGQSYLQPRLTAWFGDFPYSYSGVTHAANIEWTPTLQLIKDRLEDNTGMKFNSMLANLYRDNHDHVPWHTDNESTLGPQPTVASLSFGDTRNFEMRKNPKVGNDYTYSEHLKIPLSSGTLLIMENYTQDDWQDPVRVDPETQPLHYNPGKNEKGQAARQKTTRGKTKVEYVQNNARRASVLYERKKTLFKEAWMIHVMTGADAYARVRGPTGKEFYYASEYYQDLFRENNGSAIAVHSETPGAVSSPHKATPPRVTTVIDTINSPLPSQPSTSLADPLILSPTPLLHKLYSVGVQTHEAIAGENICAICQRVFTQADNSVNQWLGCEALIRPKCKYWVHAICAGIKGDPGDIKKSIIFYCPLHRPAPLPVPDEGQRGITGKGKGKSKGRGRPKKFKINTVTE